MNMNTTAREAWWKGSHQLIERRGTRVHFRKWERRKYLFVYMFVIPSSYNIIVRGNTYTFFFIIPYYIQESLKSYTYNTHPPNSFYIFRTFEFFSKKYFVVSSHVITSNVARVKIAHMLQKIHAVAGSIWLPNKQAGRQWSTFVSLPLPVLW